MLKAIAIAALGFALAVPPAGAAQLVASSDYEDSCANVLNFIPRIVRREAVAAVQPGTRVVLHQICQGVQLNDFGNAGGLGRTIAANPTLASALARNGWRPDDVVGVNIRSGAVDLYVHRY